MTLARFDPGRDGPAIRRLVEQYARAVDRRDPDQLVEVFTDDAVLVTLVGEVRGHEQLRSIPRRLARYRATMHLLGSHHTAPEPDGSAAGWTDCVAHHVYLRYHDRFRATPAGWRIAERRLELLWDEDHPLRT
jgi:hypothetical protein